MLVNFDAIVFFRFMANFAAIRKPNSGSISMKLRFSLVVTFYLAEPENRTKKSLTQLLHYCFE